MDCHKVILSNHSMGRNIYVIHEGRQTNYTPA